MRRVLVFVLLIPTLVYGQNVAKLEKKAEKHFYTEELNEALNFYEQILKIDSKHRIAKYRAEICSLLTNYRTKSVDKMLAYAKTQGKKDKFYNYWMGRIHFRQDHFKKAIKSWKAFLAIDRYKSKKIQAETEGLIQWAELAESKFSHPENYDIEHLNSKVNSQYTEYSPVYFKAKQELLFLSSNPDGGGNRKDGRFHVYQSLRVDNGWSPPELISKFGHFQANNANIEVVANDGRLFLYKDDGKGGLYYSELNGSIWADLKPFDSHLTGRIMDSHFFINEREDRILFAAPVKKGAFEDLEIFESRKNLNTGKWATPSIFSENINSPLSEDYPYLTADDKTLYFSSKGHGSIGGYDVFKSEYDEATVTWSEPISLNYPTNTQDDDIQFKIDQVSNSGYFVSDRFESKGSFDVFFFHEYNKIYFEGIVTDGNGDPVDHGILVFTPTRENNFTAKMSTDENGYYKVKLGMNDSYDVAISFHHEIVHNENIKTPEKSSVLSIAKNFRIKEKKVPLPPIELESEDPLFVDIENLGSKFRDTNRAKIGNIYFASASYKLPDDSDGILEELYLGIKDYSDLVIEVSGHTDNIGTKESNLYFSKKRAESVVNYLVNQGIDKSRLIAKGYGDSRPMASNDDEKNGRELNRRIEVMVLE